MAITQYYVDPAIAGNSGTGTVGDPYGDLQYALNTITRNATDGDQINVKAGTAEILAGALTLATFGTPTAEAPLILRGYTSAASDGGIGEIDCGGFPMWTVSTYDFIILAELELHTFGNNNGISLDDNCLVWRCTVHKGASSPSAKILLSVDAASVVADCYVYDSGSSGKLIRIGANSIAVNNYARSSTGGDVAIYASGSSAVVIQNVVKCANTGETGIAFDATGVCHIIGNLIYNSTAGTQYGILCGNADGRYGGLVLNNIVVGFSGTGGYGIYSLDNFRLVGYNAFYNNTTSIGVSDQKCIDLTANDVTLAANPFTDAANGDFSLTDAAKTALRSLGWPASYLGAATDPHITIGAVQYGAAEAGGGAVSISPFRGNLG